MRQRRGIGNVVHNLVWALAQVSSSITYFIYLDDRKLIENLPQRPHFHYRVLPHRPHPIWEHVSLPRVARADRLQLLHCMGNTAPLHVPPPTRLVVTVHDVMFLLPQTQVPSTTRLYQRAGRWYRRLLIPHTLQQAIAVVTDSDHSRADLMRLTKVDPGRLIVIPLGVGPEFSVGAPAVLTRKGAPYLLALGAQDPRKNTQRVLEAFARIADDLPHHRLILAGVQPVVQPALNAAIRSLRISDRVDILGFVDEARLVGLYQSADAFVYPSLYEGFGLPILEAMAAGAPVITANTSSLPEVAGGAALLVSPTDVEQISEAIKRVTGDPLLREQLLSRGRERSRAFSWNVSADRLATVYHQCLLRG